MTVFSLNLAGWCVRLDIAAPAVALRAIQRYEAFLAEDEALALFTAHIETARCGTDEQAASAMDLTLKADDDGSRFRLDASGFCAGIDFAQGTGTVALDSTAPLTGLEHFLRVLIALLAFREGGLLVHSAGLRREGKVHLFVGQSGSGKSTVVALSPDAVALNDDLIVLRPQPGGWIACGTPFWNMEAGRRAGQTASGTLAAIHRLVQDTEVYLEPLSPAAATAELVASCPVINGSPPHLLALIARCRQLADAVPVRRLHFRKDGSFWRVLQENSD